MATSTRPFARGSSPDVRDKAMPRELAHLLNWPANSLPLSLWMRPMWNPSVRSLGSMSMVVLVTSRAVLVIIGEAKRKILVSKPPGWRASSPSFGFGGGKRYGGTGWGFWEISSSFSSPSSSPQTSTFPPSSSSSSSLPSSLLSSRAWAPSSSSGWTSKWGSSPSAWASHPSLWQESMNLQHPARGLLQLDTELFDVDVVAAWFVGILCSLVDTACGRGLCLCAHPSWGGTSSRVGTSHAAAATRPPYSLYLEPVLKVELKTWCQKKSVFSSDGCRCWGACCRPSWLASGPLLHGVLDRT